VNDDAYRTLPLIELARRRPPRPPRRARPDLVGVPRRRPPRPLKTVLWERAGGPFDQGDIGSCTGQAIAGALNTVPLNGGRPLLDEADALNLYSRATHLDHFKGLYPPDDTGSSGLAACKAAKQLGLIVTYRHAFGLDHALQALQLGPVITGVSWYEGFDRPDRHGRVHIAGQIRGGHEFEVVGYDPATRLVAAWNSWGPGWGVGGMFFFLASDWDRLLHEHGDVTVPG
jgi:hypothetical protein